jgi:predicted TIM-barrel fold metal-dependent hydrolase
MRIDVHAHYFPHRWGEVVGRRSPREANDNGAGDAPAHIEARFKDMDAAGVQMQILSTASRGPYFTELDQAVSGAHLVNDLYAEFVSRHPGRFDIFASLPLPHIDAALKEMERAMEELGAVGITVPTSILGKPIVEPEFEPFWQELDRRKAPLFIHPAGMGACSPHIQNYSLDWAIGAPIEDTVVVMQLIARQIPVRYPNVKIIVAHLGGALPMLISRLDHLVPGYGMKLAEPCGVTARRMWYDTVAHNSIPALRCACETLGADRIVLGSDYPYMKQEWYRRGVTHIEEAGLPPADVARILEGNATALLGYPS